ncbi:unnamed protein product [Closterium sp. Naga37s-1]|nr:unnamed protein product [Closterium sp. Naga37s-1]
MPLRTPRIREQAKFLRSAIPYPHFPAGKITSPPFEVYIPFPSLYSPSFLSPPVPASPLISLPFLTLFMNVIHSHPRPSIPFLSLPFPSNPSFPFPRMRPLHYLLASFLSLYSLFPSLPISSSFSPPAPISFRERFRVPPLTLPFSCTNAILFPHSHPSILPLPCPFPHSPSPFPPLPLILSPTPPRPFPHSHPSIHPLPPVLPPTLPRPFPPL